MEMKHEMIHATENYNESKKKNLKCNMLGRQSLLGSHMLTLQGRLLSCK